MPDAFGPSPSPAARSTRWGIVGLAFAAGLIAAMQVGKVPPAIVAVRAELLVGLITAGWIISCFNITSAAGGALVGLVADRFGHRRALLFGLICLAAGGWFGATAASGAGLLWARFVEGAGFVTVAIAGPSLITAVTAAADRNIALALWGAYMPAGMALMMLLSPALLETLGWRSLWFANVALIAVFASLFAWFSRHVQTTPAHRRSIGDLRRILTRPGPWLLAACFATYALQWHALMAWLPTFLIERAGQSVTYAAISVALIVAINVPGNLLGAWLLHRGAARWQLIGLTSLALGLLAAAVFNPAIAVAWKIALACLFSFVGGLIPSSIMAAIPQHAFSPAQVGAANGVVVQGSNIGTMIGPPALAGLVTAFGGWERSTWLLLFCGGLGTAAALMLRRIERT